MNSYLFLLIAAATIVIAVDRYRSKTRVWGENPGYKRR